MVHKFPRNYKVCSVQYCTRIRMPEAVCKTSLCLQKNNKLNWNAADSFLNEDITSERGTKFKCPRPYPKIYEEFSAKGEKSENEFIYEITQLNTRRYLVTKKGVFTL